MTHDRALEPHGADQLPARLYEILRAVLHLNRRAVADRDDVAGAEPAVAREAIVGIRAVVVRARHPRSSYLELAHRVTVPRNEAVIAARANFDERRRPSLLRAVLKLLVLGG